MVTVKQMALEELEAGLQNSGESPKSEGVVELIVRRPQTLEREVLEVGELDVAVGLVGDNWKARGSKSTLDGSAHPEMQLTLMNSRIIQLISQDRDRWHLAGDQLFVDMDLSQENLPAGTRIAMGSAIVEVTPVPHTGCKKFIERFGVDAMKFVNSPKGKKLNLRGVNAKVIQSGSVRTDERAVKL